MRIWKEFRFEAAHRLPNLPADHKCARLHGHSYLFRLTVEGPIDATTGWVVDFGGAMRAAGDLVVKWLDHQTLNDINGLENPTCEVLAAWIWARVATIGLPRGVSLAQVDVQETMNAGCSYTP